MGKHYKYEFKLKVVQEYLNSSLGYRALAKKYEISTKSLIERWIAQYKEFGPEGLSKRSLLIKNLIVLLHKKRVRIRTLFFLYNY
ncbi:transposase [Staphylococcus arlettae]|uniref:transposase n=1 Tax=Staphylococcus arlettae TaxID=29378 RepID=UPI001E4BF449|nr:transposase [Staphylococcus arlettae]MCD8833527.1 transposase [Staphylococcus arlettae]